MSLDDVDLQCMMLDALAAARRAQSDREKARRA